MKQEFSEYCAKPTPTKESALICERIAYLIRKSPDEKWAIWSICRFLNRWQTEIDPSELATLYQPL